MIKYRLSNGVIVSLETQEADEYGEVLYEGNEKAVNEVREWLEYQSGVFGHLIGSKTTAADLQAVFSRNSSYKHNLIEGGTMPYKVLPSGLTP